MQAAIDAFAAAGYLGKSVEALLEVYGHHPSFRSKAVRATWPLTASDLATLGLTLHCTRMVATFHPY